MAAGGLSHSFMATEAPFLDAAFLFLPFSTPQKIGFSGFFSGAKDVGCSAWAGLKRPAGEGGA